ncbi:hypothetical protein CRYUN_Cryun24cG0029400 [Craigia yunnanensis]
MYTTFRSAANSLSQVYSQAMNHQRLSFQAGEGHALEKHFQWILRQQEEGSRVTTADIVAYLQVSFVISCSYCFDETVWELMHTFEEMWHRFELVVLRVIVRGVSSVPQAVISASAPSNCNTPEHFKCSFFFYSNFTSNNCTGSSFWDYQAKNCVFSNALSSPVCRTLQHYHSVQGGYHSNNVVSSANGRRNNETAYTHQQNREANSPSANDCMDMHADSPGHDFPF